MWGRILARLQCRREHVCFLGSFFVVALVIALLSSGLNESLVGNWVSPAADEARSEQASVTQYSGDEVRVVVTYDDWDDQVGCHNFKAKHRVALEMANNLSLVSTDSLQGVGAVSCNQLKLKHVTIRVAEWTWIPDVLDSMYSCRCGLTCLWTKSQILADDPDALLYETSHPPYEREMGEALRAYLDLEAGRNRAVGQELFVSYHPQDDVQVTYAGRLFNAHRNNFVSPYKFKDVLVYWSSSRCVKERQKIAKELLALLPHHSVGKCLNNMNGRTLFSMYPYCIGEGDDEMRFSAWGEHIHCAMSHYKFVLAIENTRAESYVTEKLFFALDVGAVPIYFGAPNFLDLVPPHSVIDGFSFSSMRELANHVTQVGEDPLLYAEYHAWRRCGSLGNYRRTRAVSLDSLPCRLCARVSQLGGKNATVAS